jgi:hypothetical protein
MKRCRLLGAGELRGRLTARSMRFWSQDWVIGRYSQPGLRAVARGAVRKRFCIFDVSVWRDRSASVGTVYHSRGRPTRALRLPDEKWRSEDYSWQRTDAGVFDNRPWRT